MVSLMVSKVAVLTFGLTFVALLVTSIGQTNTPTNTGQRIKVMAIEDRTQRRVGNAHVFVLDDAGKRIAESWTDDSGVAELPNISATERPRYLFVQAPWSFITGREWIAGQLEYRTPLIGLTPPGFGG